MRIFELIREQQTIGTTGSTSMPNNQPLGAVSQTPSSTKPVDPNSPDANKTTTQNQVAGDNNTNLQKLAATLKQNKIIDNEKEINDFMGAYQASTTGKTLNPEQQSSMAGLASALLKNKNLSTNLDLQLKAMSVQKPGTTPPVQTAPGGI
jgi:hypothetical protein